MSSLTVNTWQVKAKTFIFCLIFIFRYQAKMFSVYSKKKRKWQSSTLWSNCIFQFTYVLRSIIRALPVTVLKHPDFYLKTWLSVELVLFCACEKYVHFHTCLWKTKADETRQIPLFLFFFPLNVQQVRYSPPPLGRQNFPVHNFGQKHPFPTCPPCGWLLQAFAHNSSVCSVRWPRRTPEYLWKYRGT